VLKQYNDEISSNTVTIFYGLSVKRSTSNGTAIDFSVEANNSR
jgi:hypothetical protein